MALAHCRAKHFCNIFFKLAKAFMVGIVNNKILLDWKPLSIKFMSWHFIAICGQHLRDTSNVTLKHRFWYNFVLWKCFHGWQQNIVAINFINCNFQTQKILTLIFVYLIHSLCIFYKIENYLFAQFITIEMKYKIIEWMGQQLINQKGNF